MQTILRTTRDADGKVYSNPPSPGDLQNLACLADTAAALLAVPDRRHDDLLGALAEHQRPLLAYLLQYHREGVDIEAQQPYGLCYASDGLPSPLAIAPTSSTSVALYLLELARRRGAFHKNHADAAST